MTNMETSTITQSIYHSLFDEVVACGIPYGHHESDLYIPLTGETTDMLKRWNISSFPFFHQVKKSWYYDVAFQYQPYWDKKMSNKQKIQIVREGAD